MARSDTIKSINQKQILQLLRRPEAVSRADLARAAGLTRSTLTSIVNDLLRQGLVVETADPIEKDGGGRPGIRVALNPNGAWFVGVELGVDVINAVIVDLTGRIIRRGRRPVQTKPSPEAILMILREIVDALIRTSPIDPARMRGIGITIPGLLDADGNVRRAPNLGWHQVTFKSRLEEMFGCPVFLDNDANASALGEIYFGGHAAQQSLLYLLLSTGVGGGIVINEQIYRGATGIAGEIGQIRVSPDGPPCAYGGCGCLEGYVGKTALLENYRQLSGSAADLAQFESRIKAGEAAAHQALKEWAFWLARGLATLINLLNPDHVVVGGPLSVLWPYVREEVEANLEGERIPGNEHVTLTQSRFGEDSCAVGAAAMVFATVFERDAND